MFREDPECGDEDAEDDDNVNDCFFLFLSSDWPSQGSKEMLLVAQQMYPR